MEGRLDAVVFTGGIGENAAMVRELALDKLGLLGFEVDHERNWLHASASPASSIKKDRPAVVIPTNEEWVIARMPRASPCNVSPSASADGVV